MHKLVLVYTCQNATLLEITCHGSPNLEKLSGPNNEIEGNYQTDAKEPGLFTHDDTYDFALNFIRPFVIECGVAVRRSVLLDSMNKDLHPCVLRYIEKCLNCPKSLIVICRDSLRRHFSSWKLHKFLENEECPSTVKNFILMKDVFAKIEK